MFSPPNININIVLLCLTFKSKLLWFFTSEWCQNSRKYVCICMWKHFLGGEGSTLFLLLIYFRKFNLLKISLYIWTQTCNDGIQTKLIRKHENKDLVTFMNMFDWYILLGKKEKVIQLIYEIMGWVHSRQAFHSHEKAFYTKGVFFFTGYCFVFIFILIFHNIMRCSS